MEPLYRGWPKDLLLYGCFEGSQFQRGVFAAMTLLCSSVGSLFKDTTIKKTADTTTNPANTPGFGGLARYGGGQQVDDEEWSPIRPNYDGVASNKRQKVR